MSMTGEMPLGRDDDLPAPADLRASHEDRDRIVDLLREAAGDGRLTAEELDERLELALTARTYGELALVTRDLPAAPGLMASPPAPQAADLARIECHSGSAKRDGRWLVPQKQLDVRVTSGSVLLDFTEAVISQARLRIEADVRSGSLTLITRPGIVVDADDVAVRSGAVKVRPPAGPDVPVVLRIHVSGKVGSGTIKARPRRRTFWQWLRRQPPY
jgi:hypothetical protein